MHYQFNFSDIAEADLERIPHSLMDDVERALDRLADSPTGVSVRSAFPHPLNRQLFHFSAVDYLGKRWYFTVHFRYGQDEQTLFVARVISAPP